MHIARVVTAFIYFCCNEVNSATKMTFVDCRGMHRRKIDMVEVDCGSQESATRITIRQAKAGEKCFNSMLKIVKLWVKHNCIASTHGLLRTLLNVSSSGIHILKQTRIWFWKTHLLAKDLKTSITLGPQRNRDQFFK